MIAHANNSLSIVFNSSSYSMTELSYTSTKMIDVKRNLDIGTLALGFSRMVLHLNAFGTETNNFMPMNALLT